jgi:hypothetical protein
MAENHGYVPLIWVRWPAGGYIIWNWDRITWDHVDELP